MTEIELRLEYKKETGNKPVGIEPGFSLMGKIHFDNQEQLIDYINWLEGELLQLRNQLGINERAKNIIKNMK